MPPSTAPVAPAALSRLLPADTPQAALCHALAVRLTDEADEVARRVRDFGDAPHRWWPDRATGRIVLWIETVPAAAGSEPAGRRLRAEMHRPASGPGPLLRAVLLRYADGPADLVLVAHRAVADVPSLRLIADVLLGRIDADDVTVAPPAGPAPIPPAGLCPGRRTGGSARIAWTAGERNAPEHTGVVSVALSVAPPAVLVAAAALVLGRHENRETVGIGVLAPPSDRPAHLLGALDTARVRTVDLAHAGTAGDLVASVHAGATGTRDAPAPVVGVLESGAADGHGTFQLPCQQAPFPLTFTVRDAPDGSRTLEVHHQLHHIGAFAARSFARHVARVHRRLADDPDLQLTDIELLDADEAARRLGLDAPERGAPHRPRRIDTAFDEQAARSPDSVAISHEASSLTYAELKERAERIAAGLRGAGVRPGERVGICLERSADLVATMLGVLKADAVYVPMDPSYPAERLVRTAHDAGLRVTVTDAGFPAGAHIRTPSPGELLALAARSVEPGQAPPPERSPQEAAYIIYTSGSTGRPKGCVVPHANVAALLDATRDDFGLGPGDTWTLFHSSAFDFSVWEIWGALLTGARLVVVPYWVSRSPDEFHDLLVRERVSVLNQTPSAFGQLMEADRRRPGRDLLLRLVVFGGEPLDTRALLGWFDRYPEDRCRLVNMFGITETTVHVTAQTVTRREAMTGSRSVGRPLPGWYVYVLDGRRRPVPAGVAGEIWVGGAGVALEYLGRPDLTAERFVADPHRGGRLYRSGDLGRLLPDGTLEHLGRLDRQVKVRGFRIELDEIRAVLLDDPAVLAAAVVLGGGPRGDAAAVRIDAYAVLDGGADTEAVRRRAARLLPDHMLPTLTAIPELPLTANGKLDPARLPEPAVPAATRVATPADPAPVPAPGPGRRPGPEAADADRLTAALIDVWETVLGVPVGPDDNFFDLGGNSLHAVRVGATMRERGLPALTLRRLYLTPTVRALSEILRAPDG
ncbi:amino acid adenylation domain-containing protein [Streptomyces sp. NPDC002187]|uniref:amino acid adenylation domain-containing protein n=1 Tax=Streptomyces sp. NPDC002187 TaxID=3364637 RepID=UPI0036A18937